jgi:PAS domain S-box-containing protein
MDESRRMRPMISLRRTVTALVVVLVAVTWAEAYRDLLVQWRAYEEASQTRDANAAVDHLLQAGQNLAFERGRTNVVLRGNAPISPKDRDFIAARRAVVDENLARVLSTADRLEPADVKLLEETRGRLLDLRSRVDAAFALPVEAREAGLTDEWFGSTSAMVEQFGRHAAARSLRIGLTSTFRIYSRFKIAVYSLRNSEGLASSLVAATVAANRPAEKPTMYRLMALRGHSDAVWGSLQNERYLVGTPAVDQQMRFIREELFERFRALQDRAMAAALDGAPPPVPLAELTGGSVPLLDGIVKLLDLITADSQRYAEDNIVRARRALMLHGGLAMLAVLVGAAAVTILVRGLFAPLRELEGHLAALTAGNASIALPPADHWSGEIRRMSLAVHAFRDALLERERIAGELAGRVDALGKEIGERKRTELALRQAEEDARSSNARLNLVLKTVADGIVGLDDEGRVMFATPAAAAILGWPSTEDMQGRPSTEVFGHLHADNSPCTHETCRMRMGAGSAEVARVMDEFFTRQDGTVIPVEYAVSPLLVSDVAVGTVIVFHDIVERKEVERRLHELLLKLQAILTSTPIGIAIVSLERTILEANPAFFRIFGRDAEEMVGQSTRVLYASDEHFEELGRSAYPVLVQGQVFSADVPMQRGDGKKLWIRISSHLVDENNTDLGVVWTLEDISERKAMELDLTRSNAELEQFAYVASHDLRQPLRMVSSYLTLIHRRMGDDLSDDLKTFIGFAVDGAKRMDTLIRALLEYSRVGRISEPVAVDLDTAIDDAVQDLSIAIWDAQADLVVHPGFPTVRADRMEMVRLFQNLIGNAIKYRVPDRRPRVEVSWADDGSEWLLSVKDNGIGIAPENQERAFKVFQRLVDGSQYEGTGIGLAVCKKIVERSGGRIWIESEPGGGSTFRFTLPKMTATPYAPRRPVQSEEKVPA